MPNTPNHTITSQAPATNQNAPRGLNKRKHGVPAAAVYVGRPSKWGNPYSHTDGTLAKYKVQTREQAVALYREHLYASGLIANIHQLRGKDLVCWCAPAACHADVLLELANSDGAIVEYLTEDGATVRTGERVYNYYDMRPGTIGRDNGSGWFDLHQDGERTILNGQRICTIEYARRHGFPRS